MPCSIFYAIRKQAIKKYICHFVFSSLQRRWIPLRENTNTKNCSWLTDQKATEIDHLRYNPRTNSKFSDQSKPKMSLLSKWQPWNPRPKSTCCRKDLKSTCLSCRWKQPLCNLPGKDLHITSKPFSKAKPTTVKGSCNPYVAMAPISHRQSQDPAP